MPIFRPAKPKGNAHLGADTSMAAGQNVMPLDTLDWSEGDVGWSGGPGFTVGRAGLYLCSGSIGRAAVASTASLQAKIFLNGAQAPGTTTVQYPSATSLCTAIITQMVPCAAGDTISLAGTLHGTIAATAKATLTRLVVCRIGPERWT